MKENNEVVDGECYYALIKVNSKPIEDPLYRRFNFEGEEAVKVVVK